MISFTAARRSVFLCAVSWSIDFQLLYYLPMAAGGGVILPHGR